MPAPSSLHVLSGSDVSRVGETLADWVRTHLPEEERAFNLDRLMGAEATPGAVLTLAETPPLFGERRLIQINEAERLSAATEAAVIQAAQKGAPGLAIILVYANGKEPPKAVRTAAARAVHLPILKPWEAERWLTERARSRIGTPLTAAAAHALVARVGPACGRLDHELDKIALALDEGHKGPIREEDLVWGAGTGADSIYAFTDALASGDSRNARRLLAQLLEGGSYGGVRVVISITYHLLDLALVRANMEDPRTPIGSMPPWKQKRLKTAAARWTTNAIEAALLELGAADLALKSGSHEDVVLERLIHVLSSHLQAKVSGTPKNKATR